MKYPLSVVVPRVVACDWRNICEPPTSTLFMMTLGMTRVTDQMSTRFGSASSSWRVMTVCFSALVVSSSGASPVTVTPSCMAAHFEPQVGARGRVRVDEDVAHLERAESLQLAFDDVRAGLKTQELIRAPLVADGLLVRADGALGLDSVTVAPGNTAPEESVTVPAMAPTPTF